MPDKLHPPEIETNGVSDADDTSTSTANSNTQTEKPDHGIPQEKVINNSNHSITKANASQASSKQRRPTMETTSTHNPKAFLIRLKQNKVNFLIPTRGVIGPSNTTFLSKHPGGKILEPPVTAKGLQELRIDKIMNSLKLRHDLNFDPDLHYRANFDGDMGRSKRAQSDEFWTRLLSDLTKFSADPKEFLKANSGNSWTLPVALKNIKDIIKTLVAPEIVQVVDETLEIDHLMQELSNGVADLERWAATVAEFLAHCCAPIRDNDVQEMKQRIIKGHQSHDIAVICKGIASLLSLVECMALDVANHQIRCLKEQMIKETINYERHYIEKLVETGEFNIPQAYNWYRHYNTDQRHLQLMFPDQYCAPEPVIGEHVFADFGHEGRARGFYKGILHNYTYPLPKETHLKLPLTFAADLDRIGRLRAGVFDAVNHEICLALVDKFTNQPAKKQCCAQFAGDHHSQLRLRLWLLLPHHAQEVDVEIPLKEMSSPREQSLGIPRRFAQEKWGVAAPAVAVEILRAANLPLSMLPKIEARLIAALDESSAEFKWQQTRVINRLGWLIEDALDDWDQLDSLALFEQAAKPPRNDGRKWSHRLNPHKGIDMLLRNIARMTAHMGLHHWWIWETMAYAPCSRFIAPEQRDGYTAMQSPSGLPTPTTKAQALDAASEHKQPRVMNGYHAVSGVTGPANGPLVTQIEEAANCVSSKANGDGAAAQQNADQARPSEANVDNGRPRQNSDVTPVAKRPVPKRRDSVCESVLEEDTVDPGPE